MSGIDNNNNNNNNNYNNNNINNNNKHYFNNNDNNNNNNNKNNQNLDKEEKKRSSPNIFQKGQGVSNNNNNYSQDNLKKYSKPQGSFSNVPGESDQPHLQPGQMVAQSLISGRTGEQLHDNVSNNNNLHNSYNNQIGNGTKSVVPRQGKGGGGGGSSGSTNHSVKIDQVRPQEPVWESISGHKDIDRFIRYAQKNSQYALSFVNEEMPFYLRSSQSRSQSSSVMEEEKKRGDIATAQSLLLYQTFSVQCQISLSSTGNNVVAICLIFNLQEPNRFPELIICDQRICSTPGILKRIGYDKMKKEWDIKDHKSLSNLLNTLTDGIISLNQMEFEQKLQQMLSEEIVSSYLKGESISQSVAYIQQIAMKNAHAPKGIEINLNDFKQNMMTFRHYINCGQIQELKNLQLFHISFAIDSQDPTKQFILSVIFFADCFEMRMKAPRNNPVENNNNNNNNNKNQFNQNFFYDFMRSNGGFQPDEYSMLKRKLENVQKRILAISESQKFRKIFLNKLLNRVSQYGVLYDVDTKEAYKVSIAVKIKGKLSVVMIQLGDLFPNDVVQVSMKKFVQSSNEKYSGVFGLTLKKAYTYEANGMKVRDFSDKDMHEMQANDVLQFMKDVIIETERLEMKSQQGYGYYPQPY